MKESAIDKYEKTNYTEWLQEKIVDAYEKAGNERNMYIAQSYEDRADVYEECLEKFHELKKKKEYIGFYSV